MQAYKRDISTKLFLLRALIILVTIVGIYLTYIDLGDYAFFLIVILASFCVFPITGLYITPTILTIRQYYVFGFFWKTFTVKRNECVELRAIQLESSDNYYLPSGEWWDLFSFLLPQVKSKVASYEIIFRDVIDNKFRIKMKLTDKELQLFKEFKGITEMPITPVCYHSGEGTSAQQL